MFGPFGGTGIILQPETKIILQRGIVFVLQSAMVPGF